MHQNIDVVGREHETALGIFGDIGISFSAEKHPPLLSGEPVGIDQPASGIDDDLRAVGKNHAPGLTVRSIDFLPFRSEVHMPDQCIKRDGQNRNCDHCRHDRDLSEYRPDTLQRRLCDTPESDAFPYADIRLLHPVLRHVRRQRIPVFPH